MATTTGRAFRGLTDRIGAFEAAWDRDGRAEPGDFLPGPGDPGRPRALRELVAAAIARGRADGDGRTLDDYLAAHPELGDDPEGLADLAFREYRLRRLAREDVSEREYERRYGVDAFDWPYRLDPGDAARVSFGGGAALAARTTAVAMEAAARSYLEFRLGAESGPSSIDAWCPSGGAEDDPGPARLLRSLHGDDPAGAEHLARAVVGMPAVGAEFLGFRLVQELGRGAFGRVFLATQGDLADRPVALKVSAEMPGESRTLARLQHTNIVPIYSAHAVPPLHAVCMPFFGAATLADVFDELEASDALPDSGEALVKTLDAKRSRLSSRRPASSAPAVFVAGPEAVPVGPAPAAAVPETLRQLGGLPFVEAVLWLGSRLADGLAHAHDRNILHRDLKPANVLLTDDGQPMILDFNLAADAGAADAESAALGGTLPYMSPEHLEALRGGTRPVDARSDLYSLGVILFELLTGRHPFESYQGISPAVLDRMIADRLAGPPRLRGLNPRVTPAEEAIVLRLLAPEPPRRYQAARDLREDIERHLANLPLKHIPEPSTRERARKWARRHPRITSGASIATMAGAALALLAGLLVLNSRRLERLEAYDALRRFRPRFESALFVLGTQTDDPRRRAEGQSGAAEALAPYRAADDPAWRRGPLVAPLDGPDRDGLARDVGELALAIARASTLDAGAEPAGPGRDRIVARATRATDLAAACFGEPDAPRTLWSQRADLAALGGRPDEARALRDRAEATPLRTPRDRTRAAVDRIVAGAFRDALPLAEQATLDDPRDPWAWFTLAFCHDRLERNAEAVACYGTSLALRPEFPFAWLNRGLVQLRRDAFGRAIADFDRAEALRPGWYEPALNRGVAALHKGDAAPAARDLSRALELGGPDTRVYLLRSAAREKLGDAEGARLDREAGLRREPADEAGWLARGLAKLPADPPGALADFQAAVKLNPRSLPALQDCVAVLGMLDRDDEALAVIDRLLSAYPDDAPARSTRGVLLAIKGDREAALREARESAWRDASPKNLYQLAGVYATTSKKAPEDRFEAFRHLSAALRGGFGLDLIPVDRELDPIRDLPEFRALLESARARAGAAGPR